MSHKLHRVVRWACLVSAVGAAGVAVLSGCSDDDAAGGGGTNDAGPDVRNDTGSPTADGGNPVTDGGNQGTDSGNDSGNQVTVTTTLGPSGILTIVPLGAYGDIHQDDTIIHVSDAPECVAHIWSSGKPFSNGGDITLGGERVGQNGGPAAPLVISSDPGADNTYAGLLGDGEGEFFPSPSNGETVQLQLAGTDAIPPIAPVSLHAPVVDSVVMTAPALVDAGGAGIFGDVDSTKPLVLKWEVADAGTAMGQRVIFETVGAITSPKYAVTFNCSWPLSAGTGTVPASLLSAIRQKIGTGALNGSAQLITGDLKEVTAGGASYVVEVTGFSANPLAFGLK